MVFDQGFDNTIYFLGLSLKKKKLSDLPNNFYFPSLFSECGRTETRSAKVAFMLYLNQKTIITKYEGVIAY